MSEKNYDGLSFTTRAIHVGNEPDPASGAIEPPINMANSFVLPYDPSTMNWSASEGNIYTRNGGVNQGLLEKKIANLENGEDCVCLASGVAALSALFFTLLKKGDHVIFSKVTYVATYRIFNEIWGEKMGIETSIVDCTDINEIKAAIKPNTKLIHFETPGNPTLCICDIEAIVRLAHENGILVSADNTFSSPYNTRPIEYGVDYVVESLTKYINGHGDSMGGAIIGDHEMLEKVRYQAQVNIGGVISPFNAWLIMRGAVTFPLRMQVHNDNALAVARWLERQPCVSFVAYPGLEGHKGHELAVKQMEHGFGGVLCFGLKGEHDLYNRVVTHLSIFTSAVSLGHDASLIVFLGEDDERMYLYPQEFHGGFYRVAIGIEDKNDLIADLRQAFVAEGLEVCD
ncbi:MAG: PLP-dependent aspartate aminotransferase family protein [Ruminococcus sp.]|nr:PLP-dependent aspartate aminotransferase family protein [Ruminococcus sp.]